MGSMMARDSAIRNDRYWVGPFEDNIIEIGLRAAHWEVEENDGAGSLLDGLTTMGADGYPEYILAWGGNMKEINNQAIDLIANVLADKTGVPVEWRIEWAKQVVELMNKMDIAIYRPSEYFLIAQTPAPEYQEDPDKYTVRLIESRFRTLARSRRVECTVCGARGLPNGAWQEPHYGDHSHLCDYCGRRWVNEKARHAHQRKCPKKEMMDRGEI